MKKLNLPFLLAAVLVAGAVAGGVLLLHRFQTSRNAGSIATQARRKLQAGDVDAAAGLFARYLALRPDDAAVLVEYAHMLLDKAPTRTRSRPFLERTYFATEEALRKRPDLDALRRRVAEFDLAIGRPTDAKEHLLLLRSRLLSAAEPDPAEAATRPRPRLAEVETLLARAEMASRNPEQAAVLLASVVGYDLARGGFPRGGAADVGSQPYVLLAGILREQLGKPAAADDVMVELVRARPDDPQARLAAGRFRMLAGDLPAAATEIAKARELAPADPDALFAAADLEIARGDFSRARELLEEARRSCPEDERVYAGLADLDVRGDDFAAAEATLTAGVAALPTQPRLRLMLAEVLMRRGNTQAATEALAAVKRLVGEASPALRLLECRLKIAERRWTEARQALETLRPLVVGNPELTRQIDTLLAQCCDQLGEVDEQLRISRRILMEDPSSIAARAIAAEALAAMGRLDEAATEYETLALGIPADRLPALPQVWVPLLQFRMLRESKKPLPQRDWSGVDGLLDAIAKAPNAAGPPLPLARADVLVRKGEPAAAIAVLEQALADVERRILPALLTIVLRERGPAAARGLLARASPDVQATADVLLARARIAVLDPGAAAADELAAVEKLAVALPPSEAPDVLAELAGIQARLGNAAEAERLLKLVAEQRPGDLRPRTALFDLAMAVGDPTGARRAADGLVVLTGPGNPWARLAEAGVRVLEVRQARRATGGGKQPPDAAREARLLQEARTLLLQAEADRPEWPAVQTLLAEVAVLKGDLPAAISRLQRAVRSGLANPAVVRQLVSLLFAANRFAEVEAALESLDADSLQGLERFSAELEIRAGRLDEAVALAERAVAKDSTDPGDLVWLGRILDRSRKRDRAGEVFARAVALAPDRVEAWLALFSHQLAAGQRPLAEETLGRLGETIPDPERQLALAQGYEMLGRLDDAEARLREAVAAAPKDVSTVRALAAFLARNASRREAAREVLTSIIDRSGDGDAERQARTWARRTLAEIVGGRGDYRGLQEAIALLDRNADADGRLAPEDLSLEVALLANRPEPESWRRAIDVLRRLDEAAPLGPAQRVMRAELLERCGRWEECRSELLSLVAMPNAPPGVISLLAEKLLDHDDPAAARGWLARLRKSGVDAPSLAALELKLALAERDRPAAEAAVGRLLAHRNLADQPVEQLTAMAKLLEEGGFAAAADTLLGRQPTAPAAILARAESAGRQQRPAEALDILERARDTLPPEGRLASGLTIARDQGDDPEAKARVGRWIEEARKADPESVVLALLEADFRIVCGAEADAERIYRDLLARPDLDATRAAIVANNLAVHLSRPETGREAIALADKSIAELGPHPDLLDTRAMVRMVLDDARGALADMQDAVLQPTDLKFMHLACVQLAAGDRAAAARSLDAARRRGLQPRRLSRTDRDLLESLERDLGPDARGREGRG